MLKFIRTLGIVAVGFGISIVVRYWLKQEETEPDDLPEAENPPLPPVRPPVIVLSGPKLDAAEAGASLATASAPAGSAGDNLSKISGVGPKTAQALRAHGISTYAALATATADDLLEKLRPDVRGINREKVESWIQQAGERQSR